MTAKGKGLGPPPQEGLRIAKSGVTWRPLLWGHCSAWAERLLHLPT